MSLAEENNDFAMALYEYVRQRSGNLFFSPFSLRTALAMAQAGARGETATQMKEALRISCASETPHVAFAEAIWHLNNTGGGKYEMVVANSLWSQDGAPIQPDYLDLIVRSYAGSVHLVDFRHAGEIARVTINQWVEKTTKQKIRELISPGFLNGETRLVLSNAVYFKGRWVKEFRRSATREEPFHLDSGGTVQVPLMQQQEHIRYLQAPGYQAVELPYQGNQLSMLILLPDRKEGLRNLETAFSTRLLRECVARMAVCEVKLFLPRFTFTWGTVDLSDQLSALGMRLAFARSQADFSGINGHEPPADESLFLSAVFHKAFVEVNEEGTEAAAATAVIDMCTCAFDPETQPVPVFRADHPFLFAIRDRQRGAIVFLGRLADPTQKH